MLHYSIGAGYLNIADRGQFREIEEVGGLGGGAQHTDRKHPSVTINYWHYQRTE